MGNFCPEGSINPIPCPRGTYNNELSKYDSRDCKKCDPGFYCPFLGMEDVDVTNHKCDAGYLCLGGANRPEPTDGVSGSECPIGYYCIIAQGATGTIDASGNAWATGPSKAGPGTPQSCLAGQQGLYKRAFHIEDCIACLPGYYCPGSGGTSPAIPCTEGYFCPSPYPMTLADTSIDNVNFGVSKTPADYGTTLIAKVGFHAPLSYYKEIPCNIGTYTDIQGQPSCKGCPAGSFCDTPKTSDPTTKKCPAGFWCKSFDETQQECAALAINAGKKFDTSKCYLELVLNKCPKGTYAGPFVIGAAPTGKIKAEECVACPAGKACPEEGMAIDTAALPDCEAGYWCSLKAESRYPIVTGATYGPCPKGSYCIKGTGGTADTVPPTKCPIGTYNPQERAISADYCIPCPPGFKCEATGLTAPQGPCDQGTYCSYTGATITVSQCAANKYCPLASYN